MDIKNWIEKQTLKISASSDFPFFDANLNFKKSIQKKFGLNYSSTSFGNDKIDKKTLMRIILTIRGSLKSCEREQLLFVFSFYQTLKLLMTLASIILLISMNSRH